MTTETHAPATCSDCTDDCLPVSEVALCPLHAAAPALLAAARLLVAANSGEDVDWQDIDDATEAARAAIEQAQP